MDEREGVADLSKGSNVDQRSSDDQNLIASENVDDIPEAFRCFVCLDLLYKPIVLACGHISCFWCVHWAMNPSRESHCAICRSSYTHFPSTCQLLHFLLLKIEPVAYKRRLKQMLEMETELGCFSPQFDNHLTTKESPSTTVLEQFDSPTSFCDDATIVPEKSFMGDVEINKAAASEQSYLPEGRLGNQAFKQVSVFDVLCSACNQMLYRPAVLNCGHVYCESCIGSQANEVLRCQVCESLHPGGCPKVCLELDHFLEANFSKEYARRREAVGHEQIHCHHEGPSTCANQAEKQDIKQSPWPIRNNENRSKVHSLAGCDSCGMYPIIGERYRCKDCFEQIGFDLCERCYNTSSNLRGRFNQQHRPEHTFEVIPNTFFCHSEQ